MLSFSYWVLSHKLTSAVKGRFSHWTPGKISGKVTFWPSLSAAPGGFLRAFSNKQGEKVVQPCFVYLVVERPVQQFFDFHGVQEKAMVCKFMAI